MACYNIEGTKPHTIINYRMYTTKGKRPGTPENLTGVKVIPVAYKFPQYRKNECYLRNEMKRLPRCFLWGGVYRLSTYPQGNRSFPGYSSAGVQPDASKVSSSAKIPNLQNVK